MNTYIVPFCNSSGEIWVDKYQARSLSSAKDKVIEEYKWRELDEKNLVIYSNIILYSEL